MGDGVLRGCFACRTRDANHSLAPQAAHSRCEVLQRTQRVSYGQEARIPRVALELIFADYRGNRASFEGVVYEVVPIQTLAFHGKEQVARLDRSRINGIAQRDRIAIEIACRARKFSDSPQQQFHNCRPIVVTAVVVQSCPASRRISRTSSTSSNGTTPSRVI